MPKFYALITNSMLNGQVEIRPIGIYPTNIDATLVAKKAWGKNTGNVITAMTSEQIHCLVKQIKNFVTK